MKLIFALAGIMLFYDVSQAQEIVNKINGIINDAHHMPLAGASVVLVKKKDSLWRKTDIADNEGKFEFDHINEGNYVLTVTSVGYKKYVSEPFSVNAQHSNIILPVISLQPADAIMLKEVAITSKKPLTEQLIDRTVVNVDAMLSAAGNNALEVLAKSPGITVSNDGDISLNGRGGVLVLIDDKPTYLSSQDLANYLKSISAATVDKIEIMTNPPAKYDAAGNSVINIRLKKNRANGFNGSISAGYSQGVYWRSNDALNINYRNKKFNFFGNMNYGSDRNYGDENFSRYFYNADMSPNSTVLMNTAYKYVSNSVNGRVGADYFISPKTTVGIVLTGISRPKNDRLDYSSEQYNADMRLDSVGTGFTNGKYTWKKGGINLNFQYKFDSTGKEISADFDYINYDSHGDQLSRNNVYKTDGAIAGNNDMLYLLPSDINIYSAKTDFIYPIKNHGRVEAGLKSSYVTTDNETVYYSLSGTTQTPDYSKTNHFLYRENINAAYVNVNKDWKRWSVQAGLRMENTQANGRQLGNVVVQDSFFRKSYTNLFPTAYFLYKLDSSGYHTLVLSYGRRIFRPSYQQLNPFLFFHDKYSYTAGNPYLNPCYNYHIEFSYRYRQYLSVSFEYDHVNGIIFQTTEASGNIFITRPSNIATGHYAGIFVNSSIPLAKWWTCNVNARVAQFVNKGIVANAYLDQIINTVGFNVYNQLKFNKNWSAELSGFYWGRMIWAQTVGNALYQVNAALQKTVLKNKGTLRFKIDDIFHSFIPHDKTTNIQQVQAFHTNTTDSRVAGLVFTYRFGIEANGRKRIHNTDGSDAEQGRVN